MNIASVCYTHILLFHDWLVQPQGALAVSGLANNTEPILHVVFLNLCTLAGKAQTNYTIIGVHFLYF